MVRHQVLGRPLMSPTAVLFRRTRGLVRALFRAPGRPTGILLATLSVGCASASNRGDFGAVERLVGARTPLVVRWTSGTHEDSLVDERVRAVLRGEVTVDSAVQVALLRNRALRATFEEVGLAQADVVQASLLANPVFSGEVLGAGGGGRGVQLANVALPFVDALQRPLRRRIAASALVATQQRVADAVMRVAAEVRIAYVEAQATEQSVELWQRVVTVTDASATAASAVHAAGNLSDLALAEERAMAAESRLSLIRAEESRRVARAELERLMGVAADSSWNVSPRLPDPGADSLSLATLLRVAQARRLDLMARRQDIESVARLLGFTRKFALLADGTIGLGYEREPDGTFRGGGVNVPIPLFDRGQGRVARARAQLRQAVAMHDALAVDISAEVTSDFARLSGARDRALQLQRAVLPLRRAVVSEMQRFVNAMQETVFTLLLARQSEIDAGQAYVESLREYWSTRAELERAVGGSFAPLSPAEQAAFSDRGASRSEMRDEP